MIEKKESLAEFIKENKTFLAKKVKKVLDPAYDPQQKHHPFYKRIESVCQSFKKNPFPAQQDIINALVNGYNRLNKRALFLIAEMGCGKTLMGILTSYALSQVKGRNFRTLIICPPTLISTWEEEIKELFGDGAKIVNLNNKNALRILFECKKNYRVQPDKPTFYISGWNRMKTGYKWKPVFLKKKKGLACPQCGAYLDDLIGSQKKRYSCPKCKSPLWAPVPGKKNKKFAPVLYIKKYLKRYFDFLLVDEVHQLKGEDTIQGAMLGQLAKVCRYILCLTGTLSGGKASDIFYLLQRAIALNYSKEDRELLFPDYTAKKEFCSTYGTVEEIIKIKERNVYKSTGRNYSRSVTIKEKPGISPLVIKQFFIENAAFLRLSDIADALPPFREEIEFCDLPDDLLEIYKNFEDQLVKAAKEAMRAGDMTVLGKMMSSLLAWPDFPQKECIIYNKLEEEVAYAPAFDIDKTPKDQRLIELIKQARSKGRKCLVFVEYTGTWGGDVHVANILKANGINPLVMKSTTTTASKRLDWIRQQMKKENYDCLICQPRLVEVGMNLLEFPEVIFYQTGYSIYILRQASRRSYRPGQKQEVVVRYLINRDTAQEKAMSLIASKLEASLVLEGELSDKGLVALSEIGDNMAIELARTLIGDLKIESLETQFALYKKAELEADSFINDESSTQIESTINLVKNNRKVTFGIRKSKMKIVGTLQKSGDSFFGKIFKYKIKCIDGYIYNGRQRIGEIKNNKIIELYSKPKQKFRLVKANVLPGFKAWNVVLVA